MENSKIEKKTEKTESVFLTETDFKTQFFDVLMIHQSFYCLNVYLIPSNKMYFSFPFFSNFTMSGKSPVRFLPCALYIKSPDSFFP